MLDVENDNSSDNEVSDFEENSYIDEIEIRIGKRFKISAAISILAGKKE